MSQTQSQNTSAIGVASIIAALAYSGGPYPLASHGLGGFASAWVLLPLASLPLAFLQIRLIRQPSDGPALNDLLAQTARLSFFFSVLLAVGLVLG